jgi:penicillin-binding protein 1C
LRRFRPAGDLVRAGGEQVLRIQFPLNGSRVDAYGGGETNGTALPVKVAGGVLPMTMLVNGVAVGDIDSRRQKLVDPPGPGFVRLTVMDATGAADTVVVRIQ